MDRPKYGLHFSYIKWLSSKIQGFSDHNSRTTDPNFMFLGANRIVLMRLTDEKKTKTSISQKEIIFKGVQRQNFQNSSGRPKYLNLAYLFLYFPMKIEHIIYVLAKRIINFHLLLQNICDVEVWTQKKKKNLTKKINFGPGAISLVLG